MAVAEVVTTWSSAGALGQVLAGIPRDPAAIFVYLVLGVSFVLIWRGSRQKR
jgi:hypothetical protein